MLKNILFIFPLITIIISSCNGNYEKNKYSIIVSKNNDIVLEEYYNRKTKDSLNNIQSLTKGIISILVGIAIEKNYINSEDENIEQYFLEEFKSLSDPRKSYITIKHLLNQTSGLAWKGYLEHEDWITSTTPISYVLNKPLEATPGEKYNYNSGATHLLSAIISKSTGKSTLEFAREHLFIPLEINSVNWKKRNQGYYDGAGFGLEMKPTDLIKIGELLMNQGNYNSNHIISVEWINKLFDKESKKPTQWGVRNSTHGFCWYKGQINDQQLDYGMGYGGQFIVLLKDEKTVIVATHNHDTPNGIEQQIEFLNKVLPKLIEDYSH